MEIHFKQVKEASWNLPGISTPLATYFAIKTKFSPELTPCCGSCVSRMTLFSGGGGTPMKLETLSQVFILLKVILLTLVCQSDQSQTQVRFWSSRPFLCFIYIISCIANLFSHDRIAVFQFSFILASVFFFIK